MSNVKALPQVTVSTWGTLWGSEISVVMDEIRDGWISIRIHSMESGQITALHMPMQDAESIAFQINSLVQEKLS